MLVSIFYLKSPIYWLVIYLNADTVLKFNNNFMISDPIGGLSYVPFYYVISGQKMYMILAPDDNMQIDFWISDQAYNKILYHDKTPIEAPVLQNRTFNQDMNALDLIAPPQNINQYLDKIPKNISLPTSIKTAFLVKYGKKSFRPPISVISRKLSRRNSNTKPE